MLIRGRRLFQCGNAKVPRLLEGDTYFGPGVYLRKNGVTTITINDNPIEHVKLKYLGNVVNSNTNNKSLISQTTRNVYNKMLGITTICKDICFGQHKIHVDCTIQYFLVICYSIWYWYPSNSTTKTFKASFACTLLRLRNNGWTSEISDKFSITSHKKKFFCLMSRQFRWKIICC